MKKFILPLLLLTTIINLSCTSYQFFFKDKITIDELLATKEQIDTAENPAQALLLKNDLANKVIVINELLVKDIIPSTNVDYDFCVISDYQSEKGPIEFYIYTKNLRRISQLKKGQSLITVQGEFSRFFSMLDNYYTKIEIIKAAIAVKN
ncbi:MAG TPA: hypothetical protein PKX79_07500 [Spirochaetota bacterium]|nr:hypothetical protein [Spirochaetota bacterium]HOK91788.1 hypothetical protein [Spirochaetota bacterium]HPP95209.1 hypothetical protein [Spirochaetota bacterium]HRS61811.1 hypothetical protein [Spirochaetota bacterium]